MRPLLKPGPPPSCRGPGKLHTPMHSLRSWKQVFWQVDMHAGAGLGRANVQVPGVCTCRALRVCLQGEREGLASP